jgi:hypothetical protein
MVAQLVQSDGEQSKPLQEEDEASSPSVNQPQSTRQHDAIMYGRHKSDKKLQTLAFLFFAFLYHV